MKRRYPHNFWRLILLVAVIIVGGAVVLQSVGIDPIFALLLGVCVFAVPVYTQAFTIDGGEPTNLISELLSKPVALGNSPEAWLRTRESRKPFARAFRRLHGVLAATLAVLAVAFVVMPVQKVTPVLYGIAFASMLISNVMALRIRSRFDQIKVVNQRNSRAPRDPA